MIGLAANSHLKHPLTRSADGKRLRLLGGLAVLLLAAMVAALWPETPAPPPDGPPAEAPASPPDSFRWRIPPGTALIYDLTLRHDTEVVLPQGQPSRLPGELRLRARVRLVGAGGMTAVMRFDSADVSLLLLGQRAEPDPGDGRALITWTGEGALASVGVSPDATDAFRHLVGEVAPALALRVPGGERWSNAEQTPHGLERSEWERTGLDVRRTARTVEGALAERLGGPGARVVAGGEAAARLDPRGFLGALERIDDLRIAKGSGAEVLHDRKEVSLRLVTEEQAAEPPVDVAWAPLPLGPPGRVASPPPVLSVEALAQGALLYDPADPGPSHSRFLVDAVDLLRADPAAAARLEAIWRDPATLEPTRDLIVDLLASAGDESSQAALRRLIPSMEEGLIFVDRVQRLAALRDPQPETVAMVDRLRAEATDPDSRRAALYAYGGLVGRQGEAGHADAGAIAALARELAEAPPEERPHLAAALGNTASATARDAFVERLDDPDPALRRAIARGLQRQDAIAPLSRLLQDADPGVRAEALGSTLAQTDRAAALRALTDAVANGHVAGAEVSPLVPWLEDAGPSADAAPLLRKLVDDPGLDPALRSRARFLLSLSE